MFSFHLGEPILDKNISEILSLEECPLEFSDRRTPHDYKNAAASRVSDATVALWYEARRKRSVVRVNMPETYSMWFHSRTCSAPHLERARTACNLVNDFNRRGLSTINASLSERGLEDALPTDVVISRHASEYYEKYYYWRTLLCLASRKSGGTLPRYPMRISVEGDEWVFSQAGYVMLADTGAEFFTPEQLTMIADVLQSRYQVMVALDNGIGRDNETSLEEQRDAILRQLKWQENVLDTYGNKGYELVKAPEAVYKTRLSTLSGGVCTTPSDEDAMYAKYREKELKLARATPLVDALQRDAERVTTLKTAVELFGLIKLSGHPVINPRQGGASYRVNAQSRDKSWLSTSRQVESACKWLVLKGYLAQHGAWPPLKVEPKQGTRLGDLWKRRVTLFSLRDFSLEDLATVKFGAWEKFDYSDDYRSLLDDKSIGGYKSSLVDFFAGRLPPSRRRLLLRMKDRESFVMRDIYDTISRDKIPDEWKLVCLYPKEREFKLAPRCFAMLCEEMRSALANNEHNVATVLKLISEQTMTKSRVEEDMYFYRMTAPANADLIERIYLEIDLTGWNQFWRKFLVEGASHILEDIFGTHNHFSWIHKFFEECLIALRVSGYEPAKNDRGEYEDPNLAWRDHLGGFEGLAQKLWTFITLGAIQVAMSEFDVEFSLAGQGDNQVLAIWWKKGEHNAASLAEKILDRIKIVFERINHEVKVEECQRSQTVLTFSKKVWINGVAYSTELKASSRLYDSDVADEPSLTKGCSNISSGTIMASSLSRNPLKYSVLSILHRATWLLEATSGGGLWPRYRNKIDKMMIPLLVLPAALGGSATDLLPSYVLRGQSDILSSTVGWVLRAARQSSGEIRDFLLGLLAAIESKDAQVVRRKPSPVALLLDPQSLPLRKAGSLAMRTSRALGSSLTSSVNRDFADLGAVLGDREKLLEALASTRPLYPAIMSDIFSASLPGATEKVAALFVNSRSIRQLVSSLGDEEDDDEEATVSIQGAVAADIDADIDWTELCVVASRRYVQPQALKQYQLCEAMRAHWGLGPLIGVTTVSPFDKEIGPLIAGVGASAAGGSASARRRGKYRPYLGYATKQKRTDRGFEVASDSSVTNDLRSLVLMTSQIRPDRNMLALLERIAASRGPYTLDYLLGHMPVVSGGIPAHRHDNLKRANFYLNVPVEWASNAKITADRANKKLKDDYPFVVQEHLLAAIAFGTMRAELGTKDEVIACFIDVDLEGVSPLPDIPVTLDSTPPQLQRARPTNRLLFAGDLEIREKRPDWPVQWSESLLEKRPSSKRECRSLLASFCASILLTSAEGRLAIDASKIRGFEADIDMQESRAIGIESAVDAAALAVTLAAAKGTLDTALREPKKTRAVRSELVLRFAGVLAPFFRRIIFDCDDETIKSKWRLSLVLTPTSNARTVNGILTSLIASRAMRPDMIDRALSIRWLVPADFLLSANLYITGWLQLLLLKHTISFTASLRTFRLMRDAMFSTETRMSNIVASISSIAAEHCDTMYTRLLTAENSPPVACYSVTRADMLRPLRMCPPTPFVHPVWSVETSPCKHSKLIPGPRASAGMIPRDNLPPLSTRRSVKDEIHEHAKRRGGIISSMSSVALSFLKADDVCKKRVLIIGSGEGGIAFACQLLGASKIVVHDLNSTLPDIEHAYAVFGSPESDAHGVVDPPIERSEASVGTSGNVYDEAVRDQLLSDPYDCYILDVQPTPRRDWLRLASEINARTEGAVVYHRTLLDKDELEIYGASIAASCPESTICSVSDGENSRSRVARFVTTRVAILERHAHPQPDPAAPSAYSKIDDLPYRTRRVLTSYPLLIPEFEESLESFTDKVETLTSDMLGQRRGATTFGERRRALVTLVICRLLSRLGTETREQQCAMLETWNPEGEITVGKGVWTLEMDAVELRVLKKRIGHLVAG